MCGYPEHEEDGLAPQVVFEVRSPANGFKEMLDKLEFYETHGVEEYYTYDPDPERNDLTGFQRQGERLRPIDEMNGWTSPRLGIRFDTSGEELRIFAPDDTPFRSHEEIEQERKAEPAARQQAEQRAMQAEQRAIRAEQERERLLTKLRELGVDPETMAE
jgi:hypothetical protein